MPNSVETNHQSRLGLRYPARCWENPSEDTKAHEKAQPQPHVCTQKAAESVALDGGVTCVLDALTPASPVGNEQASDAKQRLQMMDHILMLEALLRTIVSKLRF